MNRQHNILISALSLFLIFMGILPAVAQNIVLQESFDNLEGVGGNDKNWSGITPKSFGEDDIPEGWSISPAVDGKETARQGYKCVCLGATSDSGGKNDPGNAYLTTPTITAPGTYMVYFKAGAWNTSDERLNMQITESQSGSVDIEQSLFNLTKSVFKDFSTKIVVKKANSSIRFGNVYRKDNRFFLDEIKIVSIEAQDQEPIKANYVYKRATSFEAGKEYLIASEDSKGNWYIANPAADNKDGFPLVETTLTTSGTIINETDAYDSYLIRFTASKNKYVLQSIKTSNYISINSSNNKFIYTDRTASWTIEDNSFGEDGRFIVTTNNRYLRMSDNDENNTFRTYSSEYWGHSIFLYEKVLVPSGTITINAKEGYGTFYSDKSIIMPEGLCGATVTDVTEGAKLKYNWKYNAGDVVPANTGLLLYTSQPGSFDYYEATESTNAMQRVSGLDQTNDVVGSDEAQEVNYLHGTTTDETITEDEATYKFYQLTYGTINGTRTIGFFFENANGGVFLNKANKAYLCIPRNASTHSAFSLDKNNPIMGIAESLNQAKGRKLVYDISGKRITTTDDLQKGIYIVNGKKLIIR